MNEHIVGIPYACWDEDALPKLIRICPVCDERIQEPNIKGVEYAKHYDAEHNDNPAKRRQESLRAAKRDAAIRNARNFGTDPSWYGQ